MTIQIRVDSLPPKKRGDLSLWGQDSEVHQTIMLRQQCLASLPNQTHLENEFRLECFFF